MWWWRANGGVFRGQGAELAGLPTQARLFDPLMELEGEPAVGLILARLQPG
jgi:hypothetical protein